MHDGADIGLAASLAFYRPYTCKEKQPHAHTTHNTQAVKHSTPYLDGACVGL